MNEEKTEDGYPLLTRFDFDELWHAQSRWNARVNFAERRAQSCFDQAEEAKRGGRKIDADREQTAAKFWRGLGHLSASEGATVENDASVAASVHIDTLLERAKCSDNALHLLSSLAQQIHEGLNALVASEREAAVPHLLTSLSFSIEDFERLAKHKPELFIEVVRHRESVPGRIGPFAETTALNASLVKQLHVGQEYRFRLPTKSTKGRALSVSNTPANFWATRLIEYIDLTRMVVSVQESGPEGPSSKSIQWVIDAMALGELEPSNWKAWSEVAWKVILRVTNGAPETQKHLLPLGVSAKRKITLKGRVHGPRSQASNVRAAIKRRLTNSIKTLVCGASDIPEK